MADDTLAGLDPFGIFDGEAARLDSFFAGLDQGGWDRPSRCDGWSVRDVLAHLAGEEMYNHACLDGDVAGFRARMRDAGVTGGYNEFNEWCVAQRRGLPVADVLAEWREANAETRARMAELGPDATLETGAGPYPNGLQAFHYDSEFATHADDVGAPVSAAEAPGRTSWRVAVGTFALAESGSLARVSDAGGMLTVRVDSSSADLSPEDFVDATVGRLPASRSLDPALRDALRCLA